jgi:N-acetyl-anhydromuramyl-L-alanine amidase AmpD
MVVGTMSAQSYILSGGREVKCDAPVRATRDLKFQALAKRTETRAVVLHWTGGRGLAPQVYRTLQARGLSVHFCVEPDGTVWQFADCDRRCSHAGTANGWSVGLELVNPAGPVADGGRALETSTIHGHTFQHASFTAAQTRSALAVTRAICGAWGVPYAARAGETVMGAKELGEFRGVLGHYELSMAKRDPGRRILELVNAS